MYYRYVLFLLLACGVSGKTWAQTPSAAAHAVIAAALTKQVHLSPELSVGRIMQSLSEQTGVSIQLADYLAERRITAQLANVTAKDALDAIVELEGWQWREDATGGIYVERRTIHVPKESNYIPRWIQSELPCDFQDFLGTSRPNDDPKNYSWSLAENQYEAVSTNLRKVIRLRTEQQRLALEPHLQALQAGKKVYFTSLSSQEQQGLLLAFTMRTIYRTGPTFWRGDLPPYVMDPATATLELQGNNTLLIGTKMKIGTRQFGMSFGAPIQR